MAKLFVVYEAENENGQMFAEAAKIPRTDSLYWWLKNHRAVNCFWFPTWKEAVEAADRWDETYERWYRMNKNNQED